MSRPADPLSGFHPPLQAWFRDTFTAPTRAQGLAWPLLASGQSALVLAPTGSGKTLAAFLAAIDRLMFAPVPEREERCRVLYVSPLKALAVDIERNLRAPLVGVARAAERLGHPFHLPAIALRTGDTPARERLLFSQQPADILITTPESLYLLLTSQARHALRAVRCVILDELHALLPGKRGSHLMLSLERLEALGATPLQRVGLSATVQPIDEAARFLGGYAVVPVEGAPQPRPVAVADARAPKRLDLKVEVPVADMSRPLPEDGIRSGAAAMALGSEANEGLPSIWPAMYPLLLELIRTHQSTLIFVNSRRLAERLAAALNELAGSEIVKAHHGSIAREQRREIEDQLKAGVLPALLCTSSLELGIDMGAIDLVVQVEAPASVASALQRIGRAGHTPGAGTEVGASQGIILPKYRGDLLACAALTERMFAGAVEPQRYPRNPLDVLAQQIVAMATQPPEPQEADGSEPAWRVDDLFACVRRAAPFAELTRPLFESVLDLLSGRYPSDEFAELRPRLTWDRVAGTLRARQGALRVAISSGGTIPDRGLYGVYLAAGPEGGRKGTSLRVGELDEEMVLESRPGEVFLLGASSWRIEEITHDRVLVTPAPGEPGKMPFWRGDGAGRSLELGRAIGALCRTLRELERPAALTLLEERHALSRGAAENLLAYLDEQQRSESALPDDRTIVVERHQDELGDVRLCLLSPFGGRVHGPWAMALLGLLHERLGAAPDVLWTDDGIVLRFPGGGDPPPAAELVPDPEEVEDLVARQLGHSALFSGRFREAAARALLLPRRFPGQRTALWQQRRRAADLLRAAAAYPTFPIVLEAYRECLRDVFDIPALRELLADVRRRRVRVVEVAASRPSPFATSLLFNYAANFLYEGDQPLQERRAQALLVDPLRLRELLGDVALRDLLDPAALIELEAQLQHLTPERRAKNEDGLHDLLLRLGDMTPGEAAARCEPAEGAAGWLEKLFAARRIIRLRIAGEDRWAAAEDAARYRDALGVVPPPGLPAGLLAPVRDPLGDLVGRYARTHGPFTASEAAGRLGLGVAPVAGVLAKLAAQGRVVQGAFRPPERATQEEEFCDAEVLRVLRQRSLARLRHEVEPVEPAALCRLSVAWQGIGGKRRGPDALLEVIEQLQGAALPASVLESQVLPARLARYDAYDLDRLLAAGSVIWTGRESLGEHDGRISLYLGEHAPLLLPAPVAFEGGPLHDKIRAFLGARGASFFPQILAACGNPFSQDALRALWDLVWAGEITNDTLEPLRGYLRGGGATPKPHPRRGPLGRPALHDVPPEARGRWALVRSFIPVEAAATDRLTACARQLLARHGVLTREAVAAEEVPGGFSALYPVLKGLEEAGQIRRGYFVSGLGAAQFALGGAVERLRQVREPPGAVGQPIGKNTVVLAATDPANPYGAALPWPKGDPEDKAGGRRPGRAAGALVVLIDGALAAWLPRPGKNDQQVLTFLGEVPERTPREVADEVVRALIGLLESGQRRALMIREVDGQPARDSLLGPALAAAGFSHGAHGYLKRVSA